MSLRLSLRIFALLSTLLPMTAHAVPDQGVFLMEPIGGVTEIPIQGNAGLGMFGFYMGLVYPWVVGMGAAVAVLMGMIGGIQMIRAGSDQAAVSAGKNRLLISLGGLLLILFSATIMNALNPSFFT